MVAPQNKELAEVFEEYEDVGGRDQVLAPGAGGAAPVRGGKAHLTSMTLEAIQDTISDCFSRVGANCATCICRQACDPGQLLSLAGTHSYCPAAL
jgi:hypothetical protein